MKTTASERRDGTKEARMVLGWGSPGKSGETIAGVGVREVHAAFGPAGTSPFGYLGPRSSPK